MYSSMLRPACCSFFFFFNDTATTEIYTLSLHDALPILFPPDATIPSTPSSTSSQLLSWRSEEHTSELQSQSNLVCRLLLEKKKKPAQALSDKVHKKAHNYNLPDTLRTDP